MKRYTMIVCAVVGIALGLPTIGRAAYDPAKIQAYGAYMELAQEPFEVGGGFEYVIDFYTDGSTAPDFMVWGFNNYLVTNFHDGLGGWDPDYQHNIYQRWDGTAAGRNSSPWFPLVYESPANPALNYASFEMIPGNFWVVPAGRPYAIDNVRHMPSEYAATADALSPAYDVNGGQTYSSAGGGDFVAGQDGLHLVQWDVGPDAGQDAGLLWTLRVVTILDVPGDFDSWPTGGRPGPGELTWSLPSLGDRPEGNHGTGGIHPVLGDWTVPPLPPPCDWWGDDIDADDIDILCANMGGDIACFDLDGDGDVDEDDMTYLVEYLVELQDGSGRVGTKRGDFNLDGLVNATDLAIMKPNFAQSGVGYAGGNANCDDIVNATDLALLKETFGFVAPTGTVPEPATIAVLSLGALALRRRQR